MLQKKNQSKIRVLFFIDGPVPTQAERDAAEKIPGAVFRNARSHVPEDTLEKCESVTGTIPADYLAAVEAGTIKRIESGLAPVAETEQTPAPETPAVPPAAKPPLRATLVQKK